MDFLSGRILIDDFENKIKNTYFYTKNIETNRWVSTSANKFMNEVSALQNDLTKLIIAIKNIY
jgi:hypothetical protein